MRDFKKDFDTGIPTWAFSQAPLLYKNLVIVAPQVKKAGVVAYDKDSGEVVWQTEQLCARAGYCLLYTSPSPRDLSTSRMPSSA